MDLIDPQIVASQPQKRQLAHSNDTHSPPSKKTKSSALPTPPVSLPNPPKPSSTYARPLVYKCSFTPCTASFSRPCRLSEHERSHTGERPFACQHDDCDKTF